jgi:hypothetical protein
MRLDLIIILEIEIMVIRSVELALWKVQRVPSSFTPATEAWSPLGALNKIMIQQKSLEIKQRKENGKAT